MGLFKKIKKAVKKVAKVTMTPYKASVDFAKEAAGGHLGKAFQKAGNDFGESGKIITPYVGLIPGIGPGLGALTGAGSAALAGDNRGQIVKGAIKGGLSGFAGDQVGGLPGIIDSAKGAIGSGLGASGALGTTSATGVGSGGLASAGLDAAGEAAAMGLGGYSLEGGLAAGGGLLSGAGSLLSGAGNLLGSGGLRSLAQLLAAGGVGAALGSQLGGKGGNQEGVQADIMSADDKAYFNRPSQKIDWTKLNADASASGKGLTDYVSNNWNKFSGGDYNMAQPAATVAQPQVKPFTPLPKPALGTVPVPKLARGGLSQGVGSGRSDDIDARLSDGEFVVDAETVAMLGDGSTAQGAKVLDEMRRRVRQHKGKALAKGKFSPAAKSPLAYLQDGAK